MPTAQKVKFLLLSSAMLVLSGSLTNSQPPGRGLTISVGDFSAEQPGVHLPAGWEELKFSRIPTSTRYTLVADDGTVVVKAVSRKSSSGLYRPLSINPLQYPIVNWRWKISQTFPHENLALKSRDDFPARLFVMFGLDRPELSLLGNVRRMAAETVYAQKLPATSLIYIWASRAPLETAATSPYSDHARMIVVDSGDGLIGNWVEKQRNVLNDYQRAYGRPAPRIIGIAVMTDTDDSANHAESYYGDIFFKSDP